MATPKKTTQDPAPQETAKKPEKEKPKGAYALVFIERLGNYAISFNERRELAGGKVELTPTRVEFQPGLNLVPTEAFLKAEAAPGFKRRCDGENASIEVVHHPVDGDWKEGWKKLRARRRKAFIEHTGDREMVEKLAEIEVELDNKDILNLVSSQLDLINGKATEEQHKRAVQRAMHRRSIR